MKPYHRFATAVALLICFTPANATLIISEYVEGSSFNKAIELFNLGSAIDLGADNYKLEIFFNGNSSVGQSIALTGTLAANSTFVITHSSADTALLAVADQTSGSMNFNGDDAITLLMSSTLIDSIGQIGFDPGSEWGSGNTSTQNNTLRRNSTVTAGNTNATDVFDPSLEWSGFAQDTFDGIGSHQVTGNTGKITVPAPGSLALITLGLLILLGIRKTSALQAHNDRNMRRRARGLWLKRAPSSNIAPAGNQCGCSSMVEL